MQRRARAGNPAWTFYALALAPWLGACGSEAAGGMPTGGEDAPGACANAELGEPATLEAHVEVIARGQGPIATYSPLNMPALIADGSGVYWHDIAGYVFARPSYGGDVVMLKEGDTSQTSNRRQHVVGIAADERRLYVGDAFLEAATDHFPAPRFDPPGRLLSFPKDGGPAEVLLELKDGTIYPFAADGERVVALVVGADGNGGYYQLDLSNPQLESLPMRLTPGGYYKTSGDAMYWSDYESPPNLVRTGFDDAAPQVVRPLRSNDFEIGPDYVLSLEERFIEAELRSIQSFVLLGTGTEPDRTLPSTGERISLQRALDTRHVYWYSYRDYTGAVPLEEYDPDLQLVRADLSCGTLEHLSTPGLTPESGAAILGHHGDTLYIQSGAELFAVTTP